MRKLVPALLVLAFGVSDAQAARYPIIGIGDQKPQAFQDSRFRGLKVRRSRVVVPWNVALDRNERARFAQWYAEARRGGVREVLVAFGATRGSRCPAKPCALPSVRSYTRAFRAFRRKYKGIKTYQPWNEANSPTQPTGPYRTGAKRAAQYYNAMRRYCRGCRVTAADILDLSKRTVARWLGRFNRYAKGKPRLWGLHNYTDTNKRSGLTAWFLRRVRGEVWLTETGGIVYFQLQNGSTRFRYSESRAAKALRRTISLARKYRRRTKRLYLYQWSIDFSGNRFDAGLVRADGRPRPGYYVVRKYRKYIR